MRTVTAACELCGTSFQRPAVTVGTRARRFCSRTCGWAGQARFTHGLTKTRLHRIWNHMKQRCSNPKAAKYHLYGGSGVTVCAEWVCSFEAFRDWALANGYRPDLSLDRKDANRGYSPDNCRWATSLEQSRNRRPSRAGHSSRFKGVSWHKDSRKWRACIGVDGRQKALGYFSDECAAARAYNEAALELFGQYASLNVIE